MQTNLTAILADLAYAYEVAEEAVDVAAQYDAVRSTDRTRSDLARARIERDRASCAFDMRAA